MTLTILVISALATWQAVEIWRHSSLFADWRAITETWDNKVGELLHCPWCLSVWVATLFATLLYFSDVWLLGIVSQMFIFGLAISRLANLGNDYFKQYSRTPRNSVGLFADYDKESQG
jgi:hypothetical protein